LLNSSEIGFSSNLLWKAFIDNLLKIVNGQFIIYWFFNYLFFNTPPCTDRLFPKMGECREVLGGGPAPPSKL
jgi:hypothetical protein